jgi:transposase-like protein
MNTTEKSITERKVTAEVRNRIVRLLAEMGEYSGAWVAKKNGIQISLKHLASTVRSAMNEIRGGIE